MKKVYPLNSISMRGSRAARTPLARRPRAREALLHHRASDHRRPSLTFKRWEAQPGEVLIINSSALRAVQGTAREFI
jgi:hypothetical protein